MILENLNRISVGGNVVMENATERPGKLLKPNRFRIVSEKLPKGIISVLLVFPAANFIIAMAEELYKTLFSYNSYNVDIFRINHHALMIGLIAIAAYLFKLYYSHGSLGVVFKNPTVICFGAMIVFMILSTWHNGVTEEALFGTLYRSESLEFFIIYPAIYYFVSSLIDSETAKRWLINVFLIISFLIAAATFMHVVAAEYGFNSLASFTAPLAPMTVIGIYHNINHYGYSLLIAITLSGAMFVSAEKIAFQAFYLISFILFIIVLILNDTFGAYLAAFIALIFLTVVYILKDKKVNPKTFALLGVFIAVSLVVNTRAVWTNILTFFSDMGHIIVSAPEADRAGSSRWRIWKATLKMISERPFLGHGVEGIGERLMAEVGNDRPHNEFLQYAAFFGIPAAICYIGAVSSVFVSYLRHRFEVSPCTIAALTAAFGYLVSSCFGNTMFYTAPLFFIVLGMADMRPPKLVSNKPISNSEA